MQTVAIIGGGPASLALASFLDPELFDVTIFERNKSLGRKFLVAGKGGFNLTHAEAIEEFVSRYTPDWFLKDALMGFSNADLISWLKDIGIPTFVGSSMRVFPERGIKPIEVLKAIVSVLKKNGVKFQFKHLWTGWGNEGALLFNTDVPIKSDFHVFALGGGSWKVTGSDGGWLKYFNSIGVNTVPFIPSNCAYKINWPRDFATTNEGRPLKNITITCDARSQKGEVVITKFGLEGNAIYALSPQVQYNFTRINKAEIYMDLKPIFTEQEVLRRLNTSKAKKATDVLRKDLKMSAAQINLLKAHISKEDFLSHPALATRIKKLPLTVLEAAPLDEAISTTGGIDLGEVNEYYELSRMKNTFCIGEMLDWNAPTGGYLLQASFSMGALLARHLYNERHAIL